MGLCWVGSQEDIRPPLGSHINQNAYAGLLRAGGGVGRGGVVGAWERSENLYVAARRGASRSRAQILLQSTYRPTPS